LHGRGIKVGHNAVVLIMRELGIKGLPTRRLPKGSRLGKVTSLDRVGRKFRRKGPRPVVDDRHHRASDARGQDLLLRRARRVLEVRPRLVDRRNPDHHAGPQRARHDHPPAHRPRRPGHPFRPRRATYLWGFSQNVRDAGLAPSMGAVDSPYDNAMVESFWGRMQVELLNRQGWKTRIELATAIHDYIELFHNTRRRHSSLNMLTPTEFEDLHQHPINAG
jgi:putative transposase